MDLVAELNNEDTKRKKFQVFKNVSFDFRVIAVISGWRYCTFVSPLPPLPFFIDDSGAEFYAD